MKKCVFTAAIFVFFICGLSWATNSDFDIRTSVQSAPLYSPRAVVFDFRYFDEFPVNEKVMIKNSHIQEVFVVNLKWWESWMKVIFAVFVSSIITWKITKISEQRNEMRQTEMHQERLNQREKQHEIHLKLINEQYKSEMHFNRSVYRRSEIRENLTFVLENVLFYMDEKGYPGMSIKEKLYDRGIYRANNVDLNVIVEYGIFDNTYFSDKRLLFCLRFKFFSKNLVAKCINEILVEKEWWECEIIIPKFDDNKYGNIREYGKKNEEIASSLSYEKYNFLMVAMAEIQVARREDLRAYQNTYNKVYKHIKANIS